jgi:hypothetical protein
MAISINTANDFILSSGNLDDNHVARQLGLRKFVKPMLVPEFHTRQCAYRFAAWLTLMADGLPDEPGSHSLEEITDAIHNA